jgi:hypothetical protein
MATENIVQPKEKSIPKGIHPGFEHLAPQVNVCRCRLWPITEKQAESHADYAGLLWLVHEKEAARVFLWVHTDGTLGLRVQRLKRLPKKHRTANSKPDDAYAAALAKMEALKKQRK